MNIPANIISFLHLLVVLFVINVPLITNNPFFLFYYCFIVFFIMIHWHYNNDTCVLTLIESKLRGKKHDDTFMGKLIKPIYNVSSKEIQYIALSLFALAFLKIRFWEKERYEYIYRVIFEKYLMLYYGLIDNGPSKIKS
jgi:hypothetical protein